MTDSSGKLSMVEQAWRPTLRLVVYYAVLVAIHFALAAAFPWFRERLGQLPPVPGAGSVDLNQPAQYPNSSGEAGAAAVLSMAGAFLLVLPVVWVYTFTRQKKGFQQSLAQTLIMLPIVVAVVVVLVKHSVALAFSLGGIVGVVAFRHRLEDTKDGVYIFIAIAIGVAVGVQAYSIALAASAFYNLLTLGLWVTDFARAPAPLATEIAQKRVRLAKGMAQDKRTGEYVAHLDQQLLQSMTPDQLKALADRALQRKQTFQREIHDEPPPSRDAAIVVTSASADATPGLRATVEAILERETKQWSLESEAPRPDGAVGTVLRYRIRCRKRLPADVLLDSVRRSVGALAQDVAIQ